MNIKKAKVNKKMCSTCPFRPGVGEKFRAVAPVIAESALSEASRICHQTGSNNLFHRRTGKAPRLCRGARDLQLALFKAIGFLDMATDEAWDAKRKELGV